MGERMTVASWALLTVMCASCATDPSTDSTEQAAGGVANSVCDPLMLDISGNGIALSSPAEGVAFDLHGTGVAMTGWPTPPADDGFLAIDVNGDGRIAGTELFGGSWVKAPGGSGFGSLGLYDDDGNGAITVADSIFGQLVVWLDVNRDGVSQPGELHHLAELGITAISLVADVDATTVDQWGNADLGSAPVTSTSGKIRVHATIPAQGTIGDGHTNATDCDGGGSTPPPPPTPHPPYHCYVTCYGDFTPNGSSVATYFAGTNGHLPGCGENVYGTIPGVNYSANGPGFQYDGSAVSVSLGQAQASARLSCSSAMNSYTWGYCDLTEDYAGHAVPSEFTVHPYTVAGPWAAQVRATDPYCLQY